MPPTRGRAAESQGGNSQRQIKTDKREQNTFSKGDVLSSCLQCRDPRPWEGHGVTGVARRGVQPWEVSTLLGPGRVLSEGEPTWSSIRIITNNTVGWKMGVLMA